VISVEERNNAIKRQDAFAHEVEKAQQEFRTEEDKFIKYFSFSDSFSSVDGTGLPKVTTRTELTEYIVDLKKNNGKEFRELCKRSDKLKRSKGCFDFGSYDKAKYAYYEKAINFFLMLDNDRITIFSPDYSKKVKDLAKEGWFLFYEDTPDLEPFLPAETNECIHKIIELYSMNDCAPLVQKFALVLDPSITRNDLEKARTNDLKEALQCLINHCYNSCARTMASLLENDHLNASSIYADCFKTGIVTGLARAEAIEKQLPKLVSYQDFWTDFNAFYKDFNLDKGFKGFSRNHLVHGSYDRETTISDCIQLILAFASFKKLSFSLQIIYDFKNSVINDLLIKSTQQ
jgi:hypothetical protein